jgi:dipeptide/tripeptide permease
MPQTEGHSEARLSAKGERFGHPRALPYLFATEMWERFS